MNINVNQDVKISTALRVARSFGYRPLRAVTGILESGGMFISNKILSLFVGSFDFSYNMQRDRSFNEGIGITNGTYLVMQNADFDLEIKRFEQCLIVRWDPIFAEKYHDKGINFLNGYFSEDLISALYLCSGEIENTPIGVRENYYYFTQHFTEGDMLDASDIHNHPWLLVRRGVREFRAFMLAVQSHRQKGDDKILQEYVKAEEMVGYFDMINSDIENIRRRKKANPKVSEIYNTTNRRAWPVYQMVETYNRILPTFPGAYTQLDEGDYYDRTWPWVDSEPGDILKEGFHCE